MVFASPRAPVASRRATSTHPLSNTQLKDRDSSVTGRGAMRLRLLWERYHHNGESLDIAASESQRTRDHQHTRGNALLVMNRYFAGDDAVDAVPMTVTTPARHSPALWPARTMRTSDNSSDTKTQNEEHLSQRRLGDVSLLTATKVKPTETRDIDAGRPPSAPLRTRGTMHFARRRRTSAGNEDANRVDS